MRGRDFGMTCVALALLAGARPTSAGEDGKKPLVERVNASIDAGVAWLRDRQRKDGSWGTMHVDGAVAYNGAPGYDNPAGPTALALYTSLKCGVPADDPNVQKGFEVLKKLSRSEQTSYEIAATILAVEAKYDQVKREQKREAAAGLKAEPGKRPDLRVKPSKDDAV